MCRKYFTYSYWVRRKTLLDKWKSRRTKIKYIFRNKLAVNSINYKVERFTFNEISENILKNKK
jgi:hypothetical protein